MSSKHNTFCRVCEPSCALIAEVENDEIISLLPDRDHPVTKGFACHKGLATLEIHQDPDRNNYPMKKVGNSFERVSWDEAAAGIAEGLASVREKVALKIDELLNEMERKGPVVDFVKLFSEELPLFTLCEMLGIDEDDRPRVKVWMHHLELAAQFISNPWQTFLSEPMFPFRFNPIVNEMFAYGERVMADRRANPRKDLLTVIAESKLDDALLPQEFLDGSWLLIIFAGNDTSRNSLSGTIRLMTQFPDQRAMVLNDPSLIPQMSEEALRMVSPVMHMRRTATEDTELNGQKIAKDEKVVLWYGAANRDPDVFSDPDVFNMHRSNADKHLAFGHGVHKCLGSRIAKMQLQLAFEQIFDRFPHIHWTGKQTISPNPLVHAISSLQANLYGPDGKRPVQVAAG